MASDAPTTDTPEPKLKMKKKSSRQDTIFPDPKDDTKLTESARRGQKFYSSSENLLVTLFISALTYVHARVSSRSDWKFNKARQNWVVRNMWDEAVGHSCGVFFPFC